MVPSSARLRPTRLFCAQRLLSLVYSGPRLPAPSLGRDHAGQSSSSHRWCGAVESRWRSVAVGGGEGPRAHARVRGTSSHRGSLRDGKRKGGGGHPAPHSSPVRPRAFRRVRPPRPRPCLGPATAMRACCAWCVLCALGLCGCRLAPLPRWRSHGRGDRGSLPPLLGAKEGPCLAGLMSLSGADVFWGTGCRPRPALRFGGASRLRVRGRVLRVVCEDVCEGDVPPRGIGEEASGCRPVSGGSVGLGECRGSSGPAVLRGDVRWGSAGAPRWVPGQCDEPARSVPAWRWGLRSMSFPLSPRAGLPLRARLPPSFRPRRGVRVARRPPLLLLRLARRRGHEFAVGHPSSASRRRLVGCPASLPSVHHAFGRVLSRLLVVFRPPSRRVRGVFPRLSPALRLAVVCWGARCGLRPPVSSAASVPARLRGAASGHLACRVRSVSVSWRLCAGVLGLRRVGFPVPPPLSLARPSRAFPPRPSGGAGWAGSPLPWVTVAGRFSFRHRPTAITVVFPAPRPVWASFRLSRCQRGKRKRCVEEWERACVGRRRARSLVVCMPGACARADGCLDPSLGCVGSWAARPPVLLGSAPLRE